MCSLLCDALRIVKYQRNMALQKEDSKPPQTGPKEMESQEVPDKEFKIIILMMHRDLDKQLKYIRKTIQEQNEKCNKDRKHKKESNRNFGVEEWND